MKSESMDSRLPLKKRLAVRFHLLFCRWCRRYSRQLDMIRDAIRIRRAKEDEMNKFSDVGLSPETRDRLKKLLK